MLVHPVRREQVGEQLTLIMRYALHLHHLCLSRCLRRLVEGQRAHEPLPVSFPHILHVLDVQQTAAIVSLSTIRTFDDVLVRGEVEDAATRGVGARTAHVLRSLGETIPEGVHQMEKGRSGIGLWIPFRHCCRKSEG